MLSYTRGPEIPLLDKTIDQAFRDSAARFPDREALVVPHQRARLVYRELEAQVERTARGLAGLGLRPGDRAGVWATNCVEWVLLQLACARAGLVLVNVNPAYRSRELGYVLRKSGMRALFLHEKDPRADYRTILDQALSEAAGERPALEQIVYLGQESWERMLARPGQLPADPAAPDDVTNIQYTSGTTGAPKGVLLTHRNLVNNAWVVAQAMRFTAQDRLCSPVPLYHCFGCVMSSLLAVVAGGTLILPSAQFDPLATLWAIHSERPTALYGVPTMFIAELEHPEFLRFDLRSLRTGIMAGAPCPVEVMKRVVGEMHCPEMTIAYGQTEASPAVTMSKVDDPLELRVSTIGCALPNTEVKIVAPGSGETVPVGEQGELCTRGYLVMKGYDQDPDATQRAIDKENWLHTGDLAVMQPNGYFRITGRARDLIIRGGENIYPREIEEFLYTHPKIADVYVVGLPDLKLGEAVLAWIKLKAGTSATEEEIREFCRGKIAHFKIPQYIRFVDSFPMTVTGKVQKYRIREEEIRARGLEEAAKVETA
ncbi:MAG TPA: AMP-binding protein [Bryobacterales bacterium]|jgi:fatty-acyl-CoA synthase|nr:AMP-binding protein [Bryobacterales bacterium]